MRLKLMRMLASAACWRATSLISKAKSQPRTSIPLVVGRVLAGADHLLELRCDLFHIADAHRGLDSADVDHAASREAVEPSSAINRRGAIKLEDELDIGPMAFVGLLRGFWCVLGELAGLPELPLVLAEVLHDEGANARDLQKPLARGVDGEAAKVAGDPASA